MARKTVIMGAAGRDFHNFNCYFRNNDAYDVVAFTATQIPDIAGRRYPAALAGPRYPNGIPIYDESELEALISREGIELVVFSYSDVSHEYVMHRASLVGARGADFVVMGWRHTSLKSSKPVVAVCAVRTGAGKSQTTRAVVDALAAAGKKVAIVRHPMPYGDLVAQTAQRFASFADLDAAGCTIEEREEYEPHIKRGHVVYAGVDYGVILQRAEAEADVVVWDGGNNDIPFFVPDLHVVVADPLRAGHELSYHPGEMNLRMAHVVIINKVDSATPEQVARVRENVASVNPGAAVIEAASPLTVDDPAAVKGKRVVCVEDGPTVTHGEMPLGAAAVAAARLGAAAVVDPRPYLVGTLRETFAKYPHLEKVIPAMGYGGQQVADLEATLNAVDADVILSGTPIRLSSLVQTNKPVVSITYELDVVKGPSLAYIIKERLGI